MSPQVDATLAAFVDQAPPSTRARDALRHAALRLLVSEMGPVTHMRLTGKRGLISRGDVGKVISPLAPSGSVPIPVLSPAAVFGGAPG